MMAVTDDARWLKSEDAFLGRLVDRLVDGCGAAVLIVPEGVRTEDAARSAWKRLIDKSHNLGDSAFIKDWTEIQHRENPASAVAGAFMTQTPVSSSYDLAAFAKGILRASSAAGVQPLFVVFYNVSISAAGDGPSKDIKPWLERWAYYLQAINGAGHGEGSGVSYEVRVLFIMQPEVGLVRTNPDLPKPFCLSDWPAPSEEELWDYARARIADELPGLRHDQMRFLLMKAMDMAGLSKADLDAALDLAIDAKRASSGTDGWLDGLGWTPSHAYVQQAVAKLREFGGRLKELEHVIAMGGKLHKTAPGWVVTQEVRRITAELWVLGLWTRPESYGFSGALTPRALAALRALKEEDGDRFPIRVPIPLPQQDRAALELLDRCLAIERLLKERLVATARASSDLRDRLWRILCRVAYDEDFDDRRFARIVRGVLAKQWDVDSDLDIVHEATLKNFLNIYAEALGVDLPNTLESFTSTRNQLAHGKRATWKMYRDFAELERDFVNLGLTVVKA